MNAQKANAEKINNRFLYAINFISILTTCYYIFEGLICAGLCCFGALIDLFDPYDYSFAGIKVFLFLVGLIGVYIALEIISELCKKAADKVNIYIINFIVKLLFSAVEMIVLDYFMMPHVCVFIASAVALVLCILYKIKSKNQSSHI
ncbi:MAG: hypothetical protein K2N15_04465 [Lachnospiraceae bacterium]|nr:hypothetical protein [Lachnospiraceae bacterium]